MGEGQRTLEPSRARSARSLLGAARGSAGFAGGHFRPWAVGVAAIRIEALGGPFADVITAIQPSLPFSERLETITSNRSIRSVRTNATNRTPLYTPRTDAYSPKPWEVAAAKKSAAPVAVKEITVPEPVAKRGGFLGMGRKQVAVAAC